MTINRGSSERLHLSALIVKDRPPRKLLSSQHRDDALQLVGGLECIANDIRHAIAATHRPDGVTIRATDISISGLAPEVLRIIAGTANAEITTHRFSPSLSATVEINGTDVHLSSTEAEG